MYLFLPPFSFSFSRPSYSPPRARTRSFSPILFPLSLRLPFYILFVYIGFMYIAVVGTWRLHWAHGTAGALGRAAASGITGMLFYAPFDLAGAKFLWWTWHDNDAAVDARWCGVPVGSTMWTLVHGFCFHMLVYWCGAYEPLEIPAEVVKKVNARKLKKAAKQKSMLEKNSKKAKRSSSSATTTTSAPPEDAVLLVQTPTEPFSLFRVAWALAAISVWSTPFMMATMFPFQLHQLEIDWSQMKVVQQPGRPDHTAFFFALCIFGTLAWRGVKHSPCPTRTYRELSEFDLRLLAAAVLYLIVLLVCVGVGVPEDVVSTGVHQTYGDCGVKDVDLSGYPRTKYLCNEDFDEDFTFNCVGQTLPNPTHPSWYTLCGKGWEADPVFKDLPSPLTDQKFAIYMAVEVLLCLTCFVILTAMYIPGPPTKAEIKKFKALAAEKDKAE